jgi:hypothetical protein
VRRSCIFHILPLFEGLIVIDINFSTNSSSERDGQRISTDCFHFWKVCPGAIERLMGNLPARDIGQGP